MLLVCIQGNYSHSLAEYTLAACNWFAKDLPRLRAQQKAKQWQPFDVEELRWGLAVNPFAVSTTRGCLVTSPALE